jgi:NAD+ synthase
MPDPLRPDTLRIALAQFNPRMAEPAANAARLRACRAEAAASGADLLLAPEHALGGAVPAALAAHPDFEAELHAATQDLAADTADGGPALVIGATWREAGGLREGLLLLEGGTVRARRAAHEPRAGFGPGPVPGPLAFRGARLGLMAGRDWRGPSTPETLAETGAEILVALDSIPFEPDGAERILQSALARVVENGLPFLLLNRLGAEDEAAQDGAALILNADHSPALRLPPFAEGVTLTEWRRDGGSWHCAPRPAPRAMAAEEALWRALLLALRDHAARHAPSTILLTLAAEPDALLLAVLAADAFPAAQLRALLPDPAAAPAAQRLGLSPLPLALAGPAQALAASLPAEAPLAWPRLLRAVTDSLAGAWNALPLVDGPSEAPTAFAPLRHLAPAQRRALAAWRNAHRPAGLLGPESPALPLPPASPAPEAGQAPGATPWQSLARADYKRRRLPPGLNPTPHAPGNRAR